MFRRQADRAAVLHAQDGLDDIDELIPHFGRGTMFEDRRGLRGFVETVIIDSSEQAGTIVGLPPVTTSSELFFDLLSRSGARIARVDTVTRNAVRRALVEGRARGYSAFQIAYGVPADEFRGIHAVVDSFYRGRPETIARTELAISHQQASHERYRAAGVDDVDITDGPDCGWTHHNDPDLANGSRRTIDEAENYPVAHPNCRRVSVPVLRNRPARSLQSRRLQLPVRPMVANESLDLAS